MLYVLIQTLKRYYPSIHQNVTWKRFPPYWRFVRWIHHESHHKWPVTQVLIISKLFVICDAVVLILRHCNTNQWQSKYVWYFLQNMSTVSVGFDLWWLVCWFVEPLRTNNSENMMTSSNGNIFRVTGHFCGEFTGLRWIPLTKASDAELWYFRWSTPE